MSSIMELSTDHPEEFGPADDWNWTPNRFENHIRSIRDHVRTVDGMINMVPGTHRYKKNMLRMLSYAREECTQLIRTLGYARMCFATFRSRAF